MPRAPRTGATDGPESPTTSWARTYRSRTTPTAGYQQPGWGWKDQSTRTADSTLWIEATSTVIAHMRSATLIAAMRRTSAKWAW